MSAVQGKTPLFQNKRFTVTASDLRTPTTFYPINDTVGRVRRDFLFAGLSFAAVIGFALWRYYDLWFFHERVAMGVGIALALLIGTQFSTLQIDARGFPSRLFFARAKTIRTVFNAITEAKSMTIQPHGGYGGSENSAEQGTEEK